MQENTRLPFPSLHLYVVFPLLPPSSSCGTHATHAPLTLKQIFNQTSALACDVWANSGNLANVGRGVGLVPHVGRPERGRQLQEVHRGADAPHGVGAAGHHHGETEERREKIEGSCFLHTPDHQIIMSACVRDRVLLFWLPSPLTLYCRAPCFPKLFKVVPDYCL